MSMAIVPAELVELGNGGRPPPSIAQFVDEQQELFHYQIEQLQKIVVTQCRLTGINPLAQEMAAGALSINIGKRPRDLLNPKAVKYMQSIFSIKDTIGKKETREISALCGVTLTQVRDFFASQRSRVRKLVQLSRERATRVDAPNASHDGCSTSIDQVTAFKTEAAAPYTSTVSHEECTSVTSQVVPFKREAMVLNVPIASYEVYSSGSCHRKDRSRTSNEACLSMFDQVTPITEEATLLDACNPSYEVCSTSFSDLVPLAMVAPGHVGDFNTTLDSQWVNRHIGCNVPLPNSQQVSVSSTVPNGQPVSLSSTIQDSRAILVTPTKERPGGDHVLDCHANTSSLLEEDNVPDGDTEDKRFLENIFNHMRKEASFSGQVKLMECLLQIQNSVLLNWFVTKDGLTILSTWLSQAAYEEQTTVLRVIFKVLCHLPLHKALPAQMSAILQTVNKLRFYRTTDISNRAKSLLSRWSKLFVRNQSLKKPFSETKNAQKEIIRKKRISEILNGGTWKSKIKVPEEILALSDVTEVAREPEATPAVKLLQSSSDVANKKHDRSVLAPRNKERRKVQLVEQPGRKPASVRSVLSNHSRPLSADDIQKAKMRALLKQNKHVSADASTGKPQMQKSEDAFTSRAQTQKSLEDNTALSPPNTLSISGEGKVPQIRHTGRDPQVSKAEASSVDVLHPSIGADTVANPRTVASKTLSFEKLKSEKIQWCPPAEIKINDLWRVGVGEASKEVAVQMGRIHREKETLYTSQIDIPPNPKEPWDMEMDFDDSLTPEIPTEQPPDVEMVEGFSCSPKPTESSMGASEGLPTVTPAAPPPIQSQSLPAPDLELLAVLLKNPELVFALTSSQASNLSSEQMVALLDMLKKSGVTLPSGPVDAAAAISREPEPVSLPSPTPPSERNGWRPNLTLSQSLSMGGATAVPSTIISIPGPASTSTVARERVPGSALQPHSIHTPPTIVSMPQLTVSVHPTGQPQVTSSIMSNNVVSTRSGYTEYQQHLTVQEPRNTIPLQNQNLAPPLSSLSSYNPTSANAQLLHTHQQQNRTVQQPNPWTPNAKGISTRDPTLDNWYPHSYPNHTDNVRYPNGKRSTIPGQTVDGSYYVNEQRNARYLDRGRSGGDGSCSRRQDRDWRY